MPLQPAGGVLGFVVCLMNPEQAPRVLELCACGPAEGRVLACVWCWKT